MKYMKLWGSHIGMSRSLNFKWQWSVHWEIKVNGEWQPQHVITETRRYARVHKRVHDLRPDHRNVRLMRRRVQANWEPYMDTFTYNLKGYGNGC